MIVQLRKVFVRLTCTAIAIAVPSAYAASIPYGDFGPDFPPGVTIYTDVHESSGTDPEPPDEFMAPYLYGNVLEFDPTIVAWATDGNSDLTDGQLNFELNVLKRRTIAGGINTLLVSTSGDYSLFGSGTALTAVAGSVSLSVDILEVDGVPVGPISVFASNSTVRDLESDGPVVLAPWDLGVLIEFGPILVANNVDFVFGVTRARVVINNQSIAISEPNSVSFIAGKAFVIEPGVVPNPDFRPRL